MPRAFMAITLPLAVRSTLVACREAYVTADPGWTREKWVAEDNLHVTVRFLGQLPDRHIETVLVRAREALRDVPEYRLRLDAVRAIPRPRSASMLWITATLGAAETELVAARVAAATGFLDFVPDGHGFTTHVTLCRARRPLRARTEAIDEIEHLLRRSDERAIAMSVREVTLFASTLTPRGPVYEELGVVPLGW